MRKDLRLENGRKVDISERNWIFTLSTDTPNRFFDLALQKIAGQATDKELAELNGLLAKDASLKKEYTRLLTESQLLDEAIPLAAATRATKGEFPEWARPNLNTEVREAFAQKIASLEGTGVPEGIDIAQYREREGVECSSPPHGPTQSRPLFAFWKLGLGFAAIFAVIFLVILNTGNNPNSIYKNEDRNADASPSVISKSNETADFESSKIVAGEGYQINLPPHMKGTTIQIAVLDVAGVTRGNEDTTIKDLQKAWPGMEVAVISDPEILAGEFLGSWPADTKGPAVKISYVVSSGELKITRKFNDDVTEKSFQGGESLPAALKEAKTYLDKRLKASPEKP